METEGTKQRNQPLRLPYWFTLVEFIVAIAILAVLGIVGLLALEGSSRDAKDSAAKANVRSVLSAIRSESALTGNSPRRYIVHDASAALTGAVAYAGGNLVALTGGQHWTADTNYSAGSPDWAKLKLDPAKFRASSMGDRLAAAFGTTEASSGGSLVVLGAMDYALLAAGGAKSRSSSYLQAAAVLGQTRTATVIGDFPGGPGTAGLVRSPTGNRPLVDGRAADLVACPEGYVRVPGNSAFPTAAEDFCLAKYEMKFADTAGRTQNVSDDWKTWRYATGAAYVPKAEWTPVADLTQGQAVAACMSLGAGYHLVTNDEWMAAARSAESVAANWSGGDVGSGGMFRGNTVEDDSFGCNDAGNDYTAAAGADDPSLSSARGSCAGKRQFKLANGEIVWDMAGNVWEHVNGANTLDGSNHGTMKADVCGGGDATNWKWFSFSGNDGAAGGTCSFQSPYSYAAYGPATPGMNAAKGVGRIWSKVSSAETDRVLLRGADGAHSVSAWIFTIRLSWTSWYHSPSVGFRCAFR